MTTSKDMLLAMLMGAGDSLRALNSNTFVMLASESLSAKSAVATALHNVGTYKDEQSCRASAFSVNLDIGAADKVIYNHTELLSANMTTHSIVANVRTISQVAQEQNETLAANMTTHSVVANVRTITQITQDQDETLAANMTTHSINVVIT